MKRVIFYISGTLAITIAVLLWRTVNLTSSQVEVQPVPLIAVDADAAAENLATALTFRTISYQDSADFEGEPYVALRKFLAETYPLLHSKLHLEVVNDFSLLYTWAGTDPSLDPVILLSHMDVVPVDAVTIDRWSHPPFAGVIANGNIWGRGAIDDKGSLMGIIEAVEHLLHIGFRPERTVYLAFGHDEEILGIAGASVMASMLQERGIKAKYILDEGGFIAVDFIDGVENPAAMLSVAEKGYFTVELGVQTDGGHSSTPPNQTGIGILSHAAVRLEANQFDASIESPIREQLATLAPYMPFSQKMVMANLWLFGGMVKARMLNKRTLAATIRTTTAVTMATGSSKENILPILSTMTVNFRIIPGQTRLDVLAHIDEVIDDPRITVTVAAFASEPSPVSDMEGDNYRLISQSIREVFPDVIVVPNLLSGATDSRHYTALTSDIYRFYPIVMTLESMHQFHGTDERISVENFAQITQFFARLIENTTVR